MAITIPDFLLNWDQAGEHKYETGVDQGVLFVKGDDGWSDGVVWNGLTNVTESPDGAEITDIYADNIKYLSLMSAENFKCSLEAYTYPDEFEACEGSVSDENGVLHVTQQTRATFAFCYRTKIGNDEDPDYGYKYHIVYNCLATPTERAYNTVNDSPEAMTMSWDVSTTPIKVTETLNEKVLKPVAHLELTVTKGTTEAAANKVYAILGVLYGTKAASSSSTDTPATLKMPDEIIHYIENGSWPTT